MKPTRRLPVNLGPMAAGFDDDGAGFDDDGGRRGSVATAVSRR